MNRWTVITIAIAALFAVPVLVILAHIFVPAGDVWKHLASTLLASYVTNSLLLMIGVGTGTLIIGVGTA